MINLLHFYNTFQIKIDGNRFKEFKTEVYKILI
jgi:hypothetical protein